MQPTTYAMDFPKVRGAVLAAAIGGMLAASSILMVFQVIRTAQAEDARWFWLYVAIFWSLFVILSEGLVYLLSLRVPFLRQLASVLLLTTTAFGFAGYAIYLAQGAEPSVPGGFQAWLTGSGSLALFFALFAVVWILVAVRESRGGTLTLDDNGLTCVTYDKRWRWAWHELPAFKLRERRGLVGRVLGRHVAIESGQKALLTDVWNKPLDEIVAGLNERREQALAARRDAGIVEPRQEDWAGADLAEVCYRQSRKGLLRRAAGLGVLTLLPLSALGGRYLLTHDSLAAFWAADAGLIVAAGCLILLLLAAGATPWHPRVAARLTLRLDGKGLTLGGLLRQRRWFWYDLSEFEPDKGQLSRPAIYFFFRRQGPRAGVESGQIGDSYDAPLAEIAAKLNDYREQALAGGN